MKHFFSILIRFDDICPTMNWTQWKEAKKLMDETRVTALLGVVPNCKDPDLMIDAPKEGFWEYIKELQNHGYTIAMHGYEHKFDIRSRGLVTPEKHSEFAGHPYEVQCDKIKKGKEILNSHGIETDIFFAPAHSYDDNTLKALAANGFKYISDGKSKKPYKRHGIICLPTRSGGIPKIKGSGYYTAVIHAHEWVKKEKAGDKKHFEKLLKDYAVQIVSFDNFANRNLGCPFIQRHIEKSYLIWEQRVAPILVHIKHKINR